MITGRFGASGGYKCNPRGVFSATERGIDIVCNIPVEMAMAILWGCL